MTRRNPAKARPGHSAVLRGKFSAHAILDLSAAFHTGSNLGAPKATRHPLW